MPLSERKDILNFAQAKISRLVGFLVTVAAAVFYSEGLDIFFVQGVSEFYNDSLVLR